MPHEEIVRLDVPVEEVRLVETLNAFEHLEGQHAHSFEGEFLGLLLKQVFEGLAEQLQHQSLLFCKVAVVLDLWDAWLTGEQVVEFVFEFEEGLLLLGLDLFQLGGIALPSLVVLALVDLSEGPVSNLGAQFELPSNQQSARHN